LIHLTSLTRFMMVTLFMAVQVLGLRLQAEREIRSKTRRRCWKV